MQQPKSTPSFAGQFLKDYRKSKNLSQEQLAYDLNIEPRTLRAYENGERPLDRVSELRRIADLLGVEPERLGLAESIYIPRTAEQIEEIINHVWSLVEESRLQEALDIIERLVQSTRLQITSENPKLLKSLAQAYHTAGYVFSEATQANESYGAIRYYEQMETIARILNDHTLLNISLTYQGDMYRRLGNFSKAITHLEAARDTTPRADAAARGNGLQLLGRAYFRREKRETDDFKRAMTEATELAQNLELEGSSTQGHYSLGTVYEEYGRAYTDLRDTQKAIEYLDLAQIHLPPTKFWELLVAISRAIVLIQEGELEEGIQIAIDAANQSKAAGIGRYLERVYNIQDYLDEQEDFHARRQREIRQVGISLRDALGKGNREI
jgi:transcriptional regulator with XRE-family HTH domain